MIRILLTDDHNIFREGIRSLLDKEHDLEIIGEASSGRESVKLAEELKPDIIVMDITMRDLNGIEATKRIKSENPKIKIIALSMHLVDNILIQAFKAGISGYILKDASRLELIEAIRTVHLGHQYISAEISDILVEAIQIGTGSTKPGDSPLTSRENEILQLIAEGKTIKQIASELFISPKTVASHRANIMEKLNIHNLPQLTKYAIAAGLTSVELDKSAS